MPKTREAISQQTPDDVREKVREGYTTIAAGGALTAPDPTAQARAFGYAAETLAAAPQMANLGLGCGDPTGSAGIRAGEVVLDIGCGAGLDVFIASKAVGTTGRVVGVDMTDALIEQAKASAGDGGYTNVEFRLGTMEALPVDDDSIDVVISNCAINLSPEKHLVFAEAARVLRPGGRIQVSDLVVEKELPAAVRSSVEAYVGCVGGAISIEAYTALIDDAGFAGVSVSQTYALGDIVTADDPRVLEVIADSGGSFTDAEIRKALHSIKGVTVTAQVTDGQAACCPPVAVGADTGTETAKSYTDVLSYVVSNAAAGEIMAVENYSDMVALFDDIDSKLEAVNQAREEGRHVRQLASLGARLGFEVKQRIIEPEWKAIRAAFREAVADDNLPACLVIQDLMTESVAIVLYQALSGDLGVQTDDLTAHVAAAILEDELEHLAIGIKRLRQLRSENPTHVDGALAWAHTRVMPQLFSLMDTSCESLCDELSIECAALDPAAMNADLGLIRARAATQYIQALDAVGFPDEVSAPLIAHLASLEHDDSSSRISVEATSPCC